MTGGNLDPQALAGIVTPDAIERGVRAHRAYRRARWGLIASAVAVVVAAGVLLVVLSLQNRDIALGVESCITPGGDCYERSVESGERAEGRQALLEQILDVLCEQDEVPACTPRP